MLEIKVSTMETLKQTLTVPDNHKLHFDIILPDTFPTGTVDVLLVFAHQSNAIAAESTSRAELFKLAGSLKNSPRFGGDPVSIQRALRDEWKR